MFRNRLQNLRSCSNPDLAAWYREHAFAVRLARVCIFGWTLSLAAVGWNLADISQTDSALPLAFASFCSAVVFYVAWKTSETYTEDLNREIHAVKAQLGL